MIDKMSTEYWPEFVNSYNNTIVTNLNARDYICGYCSKTVSSEKGYPIYDNERNDTANEEYAGYYGGVYICPGCLQPSYFYGEDQIPGPIVGTNLEHLPDDLSKLHNEIRKNISNTCYTSAVLLSRKLLMNIAVEQGAKENLKFIEYVNYLDKEGYTPPKSKQWVDSIRKKGNEATHEIRLMEEKDATKLLVFLEMILSYLYSFPGMMEEE